MTKVMRMLAGGGLATVLGVVLLGMGAFSAQSVSAESPPAPPARFAGSVTVNGAPAAAGTSVEARIGSTTCGVTTTFTSGAESRYVLDVPALDPGATPNCGTDGAVVTFYVGGQKANETGSWANYQLNLVNLSVTPPPTATTTVSPSATATTTPKPPPTGSGVTGGSDNSAAWLFAVLGLGALAFGIGGAAVARRSR